MTNKRKDLRYNSFKWWNVYSGILVNLVHRYNKRLSQTAVDPYSKVCRFVWQELPRNLKLYYNDQCQYHMDDLNSSPPPLKSDAVLQMPFPFEMACINHSCILHDILIPWYKPSIYCSLLRRAHLFWLCKKLAFCHQSSTLTFLCRST